VLDLRVWASPPSLFPSPSSLLKKWVYSWVNSVKSGRNINSDEFASQLGSLITLVLHTNNVWVQFLSFFVSTFEKCFSWILTTFLDPNTTRVGPEQAMLKTGPRGLDFAPETYPPYLGCSFYSLPSARPKNVTNKVWRLFRSRTPPEHTDDLVSHSKHTHTCWGAVPIDSRQYVWKMFWSNFDDFSMYGHTGAVPKQENLKTSPGWLDFTPQTYQHCLGAILIVSSEYDRKMFGQHFDNFFGMGHHRKKWSWKSGPYDSVLHLKHTHPVWGAVLIVTLQYGWKMFRLNIDDFFRSGHHWIRLERGKFENWARMTRFCTRNIPTLFMVQFLLFPVTTAEKLMVEFWRLFWVWTLSKQARSWQSWKPCPDTTERGPQQVNLEIGTGSLWSAFETYSQSLQCSSYRLSSVWLKNVLVKFWRLFRPDTIGVGQSRQRWKSGLSDSSLHPIHTHTGWVQFLLFPINTIEKCFGRVLTTFPGPDTPRSNKVENRDKINRFFPRNIPTLFVVQFLSFPFSTTEKRFG